MSTSTLSSFHPALIHYPDQAAVGRPLPKNKVYQHSGASTRIKDLFVQQVEQITWAYKLAPDTINLPTRPEVPEIQIFSLTLKTLELHHDILRCLDESIPLPIVYELNHDGRTKIIATYKRPSRASGTPDAQHWVHSAYFGTDWLPSDTPRATLPSALHLGGLYEALLRRLMPLQARPQETLMDQAERLFQVEVKQREVNRMASRLAKEKQFNRKVEINHALRKLQAELQTLRS